MADIPDFRTRTQSVDPMAFAQVAQKKQQMEMEQANIDRKRKDDQINNIMQAVIQGQTIASNMMTLASKRNEAKGLADLNKIVSTPPPAPPSPMASSTALPDQGQFGVQPSPEQNAGYQTQLKDRSAALNSALLRANNPAYTKAMINSQMPKSVADSKRFQQSALQTTGPDGRPMTVATTFDTVTGQQINPLTRQPIKTEADMKDLVQRGYAQATRTSGYTEDGHEVFADVRSGKKYTTEPDQNGLQVQTPYTGKLYPRLENPPAKFTESIAELGNSQALLVSITKSFDPKYVGPIAARAGKMTAYVDALTEPQKVEFYGNVAEYKNSIIKAITGAQMSEVEAKRIIQQIPNENASPTAFIAGVKRSYAMTERRLKQQEAAIGRTGGIVRGAQEKPISQTDLTNLLEEKLGKLNQVPEATRTIETVKKIKDMSIDELTQYRDTLLKKKGGQ